MTRIVIAGAGSIGCFVGGLLRHAGHDVTFLGRARVLQDIRAHGLHLTDFTGLDLSLAPDDLREDAACLGDADLVLVTVKSAATADMAASIAAHAPAQAPVISLQNGLGNAQALAAHLPGRDIRAGMVPFNVVPQGAGRYHRATSGDIVIAAGPGALAQKLTSHALALVESTQIDAVQWGKLLLNLTNAVNALSDMPLRAMLHQRPWRCLMADQMAEALVVLKAANIPVHSTAPVPMHWVPAILRLPTPLYTRIAARMLTIDPQARTSMAYDLKAGRETEADQLQGAVLALARDQGRTLPVTGAIYRAIKAAEGQPGRVYKPGDIRAM